MRGQDSQDSTVPRELRHQRSGMPPTHDSGPTAQEHAAVGGGFHGRHPPHPAESRQRAPAGDFPPAILNIIHSLQQVPAAVFIIKNPMMYQVTMLC